MKNKKNVNVHILRKLSVDLDETHHVATTSWFVEANAQFILHK